MMEKNYSFFGKQVIVYNDGKIPAYSDDLAESDLFKEVLNLYISELKSRKSSLLEVFSEKVDVDEMFFLLQQLSKYNKEYVIKNNSKLTSYFNDLYQLNQFVENFYNYWRGFERFFICYSDDRLMFPHHGVPYHTFNQTIEKLNSLVRKLYRDICENITDEHPRVYRQLHAAAQVGLIVVKEKNILPAPYDKLSNVSFIQQVLIEPPLILDPPMNKRTGSFVKIDKNPLDYVSKLNSEEWLCYPAQVGDLIIHIYVNNQFIGLGTALSNLFELATEEQMARKPDGVYLFGINEKESESIDSEKIVFFDDEKNNVLVGAVPIGDNFGYFGYLKKMVLTIHNAIMMKRDNFPVHGAMVRILTKNNKKANIVIMGDTGAGKSESLEAFRAIGDEMISEMDVIFDDMGSLKIIDDKVKAFGTETGAFVRLDDLKPGFAFGNIDRSIIMSPQKVNARAVLPITTIQEVLKEHDIDYFLYANNYEELSKEKPVIERFEKYEDAINIFREGVSMKKGTTTDVGITKTYFVNIFGPPQYKEKHDILAERYFKKLFDQGVYIGQIRTRLGVEGYESIGPLKTAKALLELIKNQK
jgi:hypothetical protein